MIPKIPLPDLIAAAPVERGASAPPRRKGLTATRNAARSRLLAQAYLRNSCDLWAAWREIDPDITRSAVRWSKIPDIDAFSAEINNCLQVAGIERAQALAILWTVVQASVLDFLDDAGHVLPIAELRKLPRILHSALSEVKVVIDPEPLRDGAGEIICDEQGNPKILEKATVHVRLLDKLAAMKQLAEIMRWTGPQVVMPVTVNVGQYMREAGERTARMAAIYEQGAPDPSTQPDTEGTADGND